MDKFIDNLMLVLKGVIVFALVVVLYSWVRCVSPTAYLIGLAAIVVIIVALIYMDRKEQLVQFNLLSTDAMFPEKREEDAGYDIYATFNNRWMIIEPNKTVMVPTGIRSVFSEKYVAVLKERGSSGTRGMGQRSGIIDSGYRGEWMVPITNHNDKPVVILKEDYEDDFKAELNSVIWDYEDFIIYPYDKAICQALFLPVPRLNVKQISKNKYMKYKSERGAGKLGSSGK